MLNRILKRPRIRFFSLNYEMLSQVKLLSYIIYLPPSFIRYDRNFGEICLMISLSLLRYKTHQASAHILLFVQVSAKSIQTGKL